MGTELVVVHSGEPRASTWVLKDGFGFENDHRYLVDMVEKYKSDFEEFGVVTFETQKPTSKKGGRPVRAFLLNKNQALFLGTLFRNNRAVIDFKKRLVKEFARKEYILASLAAQRQNAEWLEARKTGKLARKIETDALQRFVAYATAQGSTQAERYYCNVSKMQNKALFFVEQKFKNIRDILNLNQLAIVVNADDIVTKALEDGMARKMPYKEIYQLAKMRIESFAELRGKTLIPVTQKQIGD